MNETVTEEPFSSTTELYNVTQSSQNETSDGNLTKYSLTIRDGVNYLMNGMPEYSNVNDDYVPYVTTLLITLGIIALLGQGYCSKVVFTNRSSGWAVKFYLLFDTFCRFHEGIDFLFKAQCVLTWDCVAVDGWPWCGLFANQILTATNLGMIFSMQLIGHGLTMNRLFAVFFRGRYYHMMELISLPHSFLLWTIPIGIHLSFVGAAYSSTYKSIRYTGYFFSPLEFVDLIMFAKDYWTLWIVTYFQTVMYGVFGVTLFFDVITLVKVRLLRKSSEAKKRAEGRLSIMLIITHLITVFHLGFIVIANRVLRKLATGLTFFILLECIPVLLHLLMGFVVTYFNLPYKSKKNGPQTTISITPHPTLGQTPQKSILKKSS